MKCSVEDCGREAHYKAVCLCQKHYFRQWRYGTTELSRKANPRVVMPGRGYIQVHAPGHPLAGKNHYVAEHRKIVYDRIGESLSECEMCGTPVNWKTVHIDHIDNNPQNNDPSNLRPLCRGCNVHRDYPEPHTFDHCHAITFGGITMTAKAWGKVTNGFITGATLVRRLKAGMDVEAALFTPKVTHGKGMPPPYTREGLIEIARHYRAEARRIGGKK